MSSYNESVIAFKKAQDREAILKDQLSTLKDEFARANKTLIEDLKEASDQANTAKEQVVACAEALYKETGNKKLPGGIGIRIPKVLKYELDKALEWCSSKGMFLSLDKKAFEKAAGDLDLPFVSQSDGLSVTFPTKGIDISTLE